MLSIVITTYKEERTIGKAIDSIISQKIPEKYELIIVCPDQPTIQIIKKYMLKYKQIKLIKDKDKGKPAALNLVFKKAKGRILILTDGDVFLENGSIKKLLDGFTSSEIGAVCGRPIATNPRNTKMGYWAHLLADAAHEKRLESKNKFILCSGYLYAIKNIIDKIPINVLDDSAISHLIAQKGYKINYVPSAKVYVKFPETFSDWIKQKKRNAGGDHQLGKIIKKKQEMRSFLKESSHFWFPFKYSKNFKEFCWSFLILFARLYLWFLIFIDFKLRKKNLKQIWVRIDSTK